MEVVSLTSKECDDYKDLWPSSVELITRIGYLEIYLHRRLIQLLLMAKGCKITLRIKCKLAPWYSHEAIT